MYSGITQGVFTVVAVQKKPGLIDYTVELNELLTQQLTLGASISIDGVCQSVTAISGHRVSFDAMQQTLNLTTLNELTPGRQVSVERSLRFGDEVGGHVMAGHVSGTATLVQRDEAPNNLRLTFEGPASWFDYIFPQGFIGIDGSSLTVASVDTHRHCFSVCLIPETLRLTTLGQKAIGDRVNIELDHQAIVIVETVKRFQAQQINH